jgi:hypothetical protein
VALWLVAQAVQLDPADHHGILLITTHPVLIAGPGPNHCRVILAFCTIATKKYKLVRKKNMEKT